MPGPNVSLGVGFGFEQVVAFEAGLGGRATGQSVAVFFDWDSADLSRRARQIVAQASRRDRAVRIEVHGYTDSSGPPGYSERLSVRRGLNIQAELVRDGVAAGEIGIRGLGETGSLVRSAKEVRETQDRRIEIVLR